MFDLMSQAWQDFIKRSFPFLKSHKGQYYLYFRETDSETETDDIVLYLPHTGVGNCKVRKIV